ncbi:MAG TPA: hypothetical protein P5069_13395 [Candidatus Hydrogenedentes bacterium]|nr:hypothetical protein [Candidatus Hydrogenedentota bacterium]
MNLREFVNDNREEGWEKISGYADVVREERHFCAVLYHCMLSDPKGMERFLQLCGVEKKEPSSCREYRVFVEYAMARDLWNCLREDETKNEAKREFLVAHAELPSRFSEKSMGVASFNEALVAGPRSKKYIQSPARWSESSLAIIFAEDRTSFQKALMLKWAFNIKPDLVIELDNDEVVCIEAKVESSEDSYGKDGSRKSQQDVQEHLMEELLGYRKVYMKYLCRKKTKMKPDALTWSEAINAFQGEASAPVALKEFLGKTRDQIYRKQKGQQ